MAAGAEELLALTQESARLHRALSALSDIQRQLIALAFFSDMSHQAIAAAAQVATRHGEISYPPRSECSSDLFTAGLTLCRNAVRYRTLSWSRLRWSLSWRRSNRGH